MKRTFALLVAVGMLSFTVGSAMAGGIDHKTNFSAEYARTLNRNAATDYADAVVYNPAGTAFMVDGLYLNGSLQYLDKSYTNTVGGTDYESDTPSLLPGFFALYKRDNWSTYFGFSNYGGGGKVEYDDGNAQTFAIGMQLLGLAYGAFGYDPPPTAQSLEANSMYLGYTLGGAYKVNDQLSFSLGLRYINASQEIKANLTLSDLDGPAPDVPFTVDTERTASGIGGILGVNYSPIEALNLALRYETATPLEFENDTSRDLNDTNPALPPLFADGAKSDRDLPPLLGFGASYQINEKMRTEFNYTWYMNTQADWDGAEDDVDDGFDIGIAFEYDINEAFTASAGYLFTESGISAENTEWSAPRLDANTIGGGVAWKASDRLDVNAGISYISYEADKTSMGFELDSEVLIIAAGVQYRFL